MKYIYKGASGVVPGIGVFETEQEVSAEEASLLQAAGYVIEEEIGAVRSTTHINEEGGE